MDPGESPLDRHRLAFRAGGHLAEGQRAAKDVRRGFELAAQEVGERAFFGVGDGTAVMDDGPAQQAVGALGVAQVTRAVERVQGMGFSGAESKG
jgi:hypothetical protein